MLCNDTPIICIVKKWHVLKLDKPLFWWVVSDIWHVLGFISIASFMGSCYLSVSLNLRTWSGKEKRKLKLRNTLTFLKIYFGIIAIFIGMFLPLYVYWGGGGAPILKYILETCFWDEKLMWVKQCRNHHVCRKVIFFAKELTIFFNVSDCSEVDGEDEKKRLHISMLHKPDTEGCSEFLGCMSFGVKHLLAKQKVKKICTIFALFVHWESTNISLIR